MKGTNYRMSAPVGSVRRSMQTNTSIAQPTNQAMQRRFKLSDALGKMQGAAKK